MALPEELLGLVPVAQEGILFLDQLQRLVAVVARDMEIPAVLEHLVAQAEAQVAPIAALPVQAGRVSAVKETRAVKVCHLRELMERRAVAARGLWV